MREGDDVGLGLGSILSTALTRLPDGEAVECEEREILNVWHEQQGTSDSIMELGKRRGVENRIGTRYPCGMFI